MPREKVETVYTLDELKESHPDGYAAALKRWEKMHDESGECPWAGEIIDSLKAVVDACGGYLKNWAIGPYCGSWCRVSVDDEYEVDAEDGSDSTEWTPKGVDWLWAEVLEPKRYTKNADGIVESVSMKTSSKKFIESSLEVLR